MERGWTRATLGLPLALALLTVTAATLPAQRLNFTSYTGFEGLPQSQVLGLAQDGDGFLWVGSYGGLSRYDGHRFLTLTTRDGLGSNAVGAMACDPHGRLWVGTLGGGVSVLEHLRVVRTLRAPRDLAGNYVQDISTASDGTVWVATDTGATRIRGGAVRHFTAAEGLPSTNVWQVRTLDDGRVVAATAAGLAVLDGNRFVPLPIRGLEGRPVLAVLGLDGGLLAATEEGVMLADGNSARRLPLPGGDGSPMVVDMARGPDGTVWMAARNGVYRLTGGRVTRLTRKNGLLADNVHRVMVDREGIVWFGTDSGLSKLVPNPFTGWTSEDWLPHDVVRAMAEDSHGRLWFGTRNGIAVLDGERARVIPGRDLPDPRVYALAPLPRGGMLVGTRRGLCLFDGLHLRRVWRKPDGLPGTVAVALAAVPGRDQAWVGTDRGTVLWSHGRFVRPPDPELAGARPLALRMDERGRLWVGLRAGGVLVARDGTVISHFGAREGLSDQTVWSLAPGRDGGMWVGTNGDGAFDVRGDSIRRLCTREGLVDDFVWQVLVDRRGAVWFYTSRGLDRLRGRRIRHFGRGDGLLNLEGMAGACLEDSRGILWFACGSGLMRYDPAAESRSPPPPRVFVEGILSSRNGPLGNGATIPYPPGILTVELASPWYRDESALRFRHRLLPVDPRWSEPTASPFVTLAAVGPGTYRLEAVAVDADGRRSPEPAVVSFTVLHPWWERPETLVAAAVLLIVLVVLVARWRTRRLEAERRRLEELVEERTRELQRLAVTDELTGTANRRRFAEVLREELRRLSRAPDEARLSLLLVDLDGFKGVNDTWGHEVGDRLLAAIGAALTEAVRSSDLVARYGGDEFAVILPMTDRDGARRVAAKILEKLEAARIPVPGGETGVTASIGIAVVAPSAAVEEELHRLIADADQALYVAKRAGGGRVHVENDTLY